jgi:hypothetical protein
MLKMNFNQSLFMNFNTLNKSKTTEATALFTTLSLLCLVIR